MVLVVCEFDFIKKKMHMFGKAERESKKKHCLLVFLVLIYFGFLTPAFSSKLLLLIKQTDQNLTNQRRRKCIIANKHHILHLLLSIVTAGIWLIVWILFIQAKDPQCSVCGRSNDFLGNLLHKQKKNIEKNLK